MAIKIAVCVMMKNEEIALRKTLNSVKDVVNGYILYDTGSTDATLTVAKEYEPSHVLKGKFIDFATSRNELLTFAKSFTCLYNYFLLMDCNEQLQHYNLREEIGTECDAYYVRQIWFTGYNTEFYNIRLIRSNLECKYIGRVHEYLELPPDCTPNVINVTYLYQDRGSNCTSSVIRWKQDVALLNQDALDDDKNCRTMFYLAQTYECLNDHENAYKWYKKRSNQECNFIEERYLSTERCGDLATTIAKKIYWYVKASDLMLRVEPLIKLAKLFQKKKKFYLAYPFIAMACSLPYPTNCILFVNKTDYDYTRWHLMGIIAYYVQRYDEGKKACQKAIDTGKNITLDENNLEFYTKKEQEHE